MRCRHITKPAQDLSRNMLRLSLDEGVSDHVELHDTRQLLKSVEFSCYGNLTKHHIIVCTQQLSWHGPLSLSAHVTYGGRPPFS